MPSISWELFLRSKAMPRVQPPPIEKHWSSTPVTSRQERKSLRFRTRMALETIPKASGNSKNISVRDVSRMSSRSLKLMSKSTPNRPGVGTLRSEERRVGKECRSEGSPHHSQKTDHHRSDGLSNS